MTSSDGKAGPAPQIFISYRRSDSAGHARALHGELKRRLGGGMVFFDRESIDEGVDFPERLRAAAESCAVCLVLIGPDWLEVRSASGGRRLDDPNDFVRQEITTALGAGRYVIPVLFDDTAVPGADELPEPLRPLSARDALNLRGKAYEYEAQVDRLVQRVASALPKPPTLTASPTRYLTWLRDQHAYLDIRGMGAKVAQRMKLAHVYTRLSVTGGARLPRPVKAERKARARRTGKAPEPVSMLDERATRAELRDVLQANPNAALIGDPGSGKTTFLRYVAQFLARAHLGDDGALQELGFTGEPAFPIFVRLADLAAFLSANPRSELSEDAEEHLCRFLDHMLAGNPNGLPLRYLRDRVHAGGCMLLLDGLDEVPGEAMRERMVRLLENVVMYGAQVGNRHLVTCRTRAWEGRVQLTGDIADLRLLAFGPDEVREFTYAWARALFEVPAEAKDDEPRLREALDYHEQLRQAIADNPSGQTFAESPLMLTVLAVVHWSDKQLPEERAEIYERAVKYLIDTRKGQSSFQARLRQECLQAIAVAMFEHPKGVQRAISRSKAAAAVAALTGCSAEDAARFVEEEELHSGLLVARTEGLEFWHLTFQEYLCALAFSPLNDKRWERLRPHLDDDRWNEVLLLLAGCERRNGLEEARELISRVLSTGSDLVSNARAVALVSRMLRDLAPSGGDASHGTGYEQRLGEALGVFEPGGASVEERVRNEVGHALGRVGDPRLRERKANRVLIPGGTFRMGAQKTDQRGRNYDMEAFDDESPVHKVTVSSFEIGRYNVTVGEFAEFLSAGDSGYLAQANWSEEGAAWREQMRRIEPDNWSRQRRFPNRPVVGVSWYEGEAYARWVGGRLPTEAEWEWVARGATGRKYPWGDDAPTDRHANFSMRVGEPTPVGLYPADKHEHGVRDLAGNVWEWCSDWFNDYHSDSNTVSNDPDSDSSRVLRGGSFRDDAQHLRGAYRLYRPGLDYPDAGFRVVWPVAGGQP
jgi:formylglycine-generating enzyme required for sulfatase activity